MPDKLGGRSLRVACQLRVTGKFKSIGADCRCTFRCVRHLASSRTVPQGPRTCPWTLTPSSHPPRPLFQEVKFIKCIPAPWPLSHHSQCVLSLVCLSPQYFYGWGFPGGSMGKNPRQQEPLEKGMAAHSSIPAWEIPWTEEPGKLQSMG